MFSRTRFCSSFLARSSTTPSRNFTTSPKLSSNSTASISSTVTNGDSSCSPGYTLNNSTSSGNRQAFSSDFSLPSLLLSRHSVILYLSRGLIYEKGCVGSVLIVQICIKHAYTHTWCLTPTCNSWLPETSRVVQSLLCFMWHRRGDFCFSFSVMTNVPSSTPVVSSCLCLQILTGFNDETQ